MNYADDDTPPERQEEIAKAIRSMGDKLVALGYATGVICDDRTGQVHVVFTHSGLRLQDDISRIFAAVSAGERLEFDELQAFMVILAMKPGGDSTHGSTPPTG